MTEPTPLLTTIFNGMVDGLTDLRNRSGLKLEFTARIRPPDSETSIFGHTMGIWTNVPCVDDPEGKLFVYACDGEGEREFSVLASKEQDKDGMTYQGFGDVDLSQMIKEALEFIEDRAIKRGVVPPKTQRSLPISKPAKHGL